MATIKQVSEFAGVSQATVSRVMNGSARVAQETREKVEQAMTALGYRPNAFAQSLASNRSNTVGLIVSELYGPYYGQLMGGLEQVLRENSKYLLIASSHSDEQLEKEAVEFLLSRRCDALVMHAERLSDSTLDALAERVPLVCLNRQVASERVCSVYLDNVLGGALAARHLVELGHRHIACITGPSWKQDAMDRLKGFKQVMTDAGISVRANQITESAFNEGGGRQAAAELLERFPEMTALIAGDDDIAIGAIGLLCERGYRVPQDISVIGYDDVPYAPHFSPPLSTIRIPISDMAGMAARQILNTVYSQHNSLQLNFEPQLVPRQSTAAPGA